MTWARLLFLLAGATSAWGESPQNVRYDELPQLIRERNAHARAARTREEAADALTGHLARSYLPKLEASGGFESFLGSGIGDDTQPFGRVQAQLNLFRGGRDRLEESIRQAQRRAAAVESDAAFLEELSKARTVYWDLIFQKQMEKILSEAFIQNERHQSAAKQRIQAGMATRTDTLEFQMNRVQLEQDRTRARISRMSLETTLRALLGFSPSDPIQTEAEIPHVHEDPLLRTEMKPNGHRSLRLLDEHLSESRLSAAKAGRWWVPSVDAYGSYTLYTSQEREFTSQGERTELAAGVSVTIPLFDGLEASASRRASLLRSDAFEQERLQSARELSASHQSARNELELVHSLLDSAEEGARLADDYLAETVKEYRRGLKNSPDVLGATQKALELRRRAVELRRDYQSARTALLSLLGE